jgi:hypothetical protein
MEFTDAVSNLRLKTHTDPKDAAINFHELTNVMSERLIAELKQFEKDKERLLPKDPYKNQRFGHVGIN